MKRQFVLSVISLLCISDLFSQDIIPKNPFALALDYARFRNNDQSGYLEIYYAFYPYLLTFQKIDGKYKASIELQTQLTNNNTGELEINEREHLPIVVSDSSEALSQYAFTTQAGYALPFGDYTLKVVAADSFISARRDSSSLKISVDPYPNELGCSDLELCSNIKASQNKKDPFYKNSLEVVPNPTIVYGITAHPVVFHYLELYDLNPDETYTVKQQVTDDEGKIVRESSKSRQFKVKNAIDVGTMNVTSLLSGKYHFGLLLLDQNSMEQTRSEKTFFVHNPHLTVSATAVPSFDANELVGLSKEELSEEFLQAKYIATDEEIKLFEQVDSEAGKRELLAKFWDNVQKGRLDHQPIKRGEYLKRVEVANTRYREMGKAGWRTHRGRVYLLYGEPDDTERFPSLGESKPYEIWHYHGIESGVVFVFIDRLGYGYYELVHSTKRGELYDNNWERFLR